MNIANAPVSIPASQWHTIATRWEVVIEYADGKTSRLTHRGRDSWIEKTAHRYAAEFTAAHGWTNIKTITVQPT